MKIISENTAVHPKQVPLGKRNATYQVLQSLLTNRNNRHREKRFIVESVKALERLLESHWPIESLLVQEGVSNALIRRLMGSAKPETIYQVSPELMVELSDKDQASEVLAVARIPDLRATALPVSKDGAYVIVDRPNSPGNLGSLIRTAEAFGAKAVLTYGHAVDFFDPKTIRASIGSVFSIPLAHMDSNVDFDAWQRLFENAGTPTQLVALDENGDVECGKLKSKGVRIVVIGNETDGLSKLFKERCDIKVRIPMAGRATSLNAACSGSILLYELLAR